MGALLDEAVAVRVRRAAQYVGVEHLFEAVLAMPEAVPEALRETDVSSLHQAVERAYRDAWRGNLPIISGEIFYTPRCAAITYEAARLAWRLRSASTTTGHTVSAARGRPRST